MSHALEVVEATPDHALGRVGGAVLYIWRGVTTVRAANRLRQLSSEARADAGDDEGILLGVVTEGAPPPEADARGALAEVLSSGAGYFQVSALVCEGAGFHGSMVRAVATGLNLLARPPFPHRVFATVPSATEWLDERARAAGLTRYRASDVASQMEALRAAPMR